MENSSVSNDVFNDTTTASSNGGFTAFTFPYAQVIYVITSTVGVIGNLFVITIFVFFIKVTDKVMTLQV